MNFDVNLIRSQFPALEQTFNDYPLRYFDNAATTLKPLQVIASLSDFYFTINANVHRSNYTLSSKATDAYENARNKIAKYINCEAEEVIFTSGTTDSINTIVNLLSKNFLNEGDEIIISITEHHSNYLPWIELGKLKGIKVKILNIDDSGNFSIDQLKDLINEKTKVISLCQISNILGIINPIEEIIKIAGKVGIITVIDGAQAVQHSMTDVKSLDCDFYCFSGHKMFGPMGIGVIYGRKEILQNMEPVKFGGGMIRTLDQHKIHFEDIPYKFEAGTPNVGGAVGLGAAIDFIESIGINYMNEYENQLTEYLQNKLVEISGLSIYGHSENKIGVITLNIEGVHHSDIGFLLDKFGIAVRSGQLCAQPLMQRLGIEGAIRISLSSINKVQEIDFLTEKLKVAIKMLS